MDRDTDRWTSGADYDQWMGRWSRLLAREFLKWLELPRSLRWIDICCGSGVVTETIVELCPPASVNGIDASSQQIEFARQHRAHPNVTFQTGNAMALPFADSSFDVAVCGLGLNYIPQPEQGLKEFRRVVCPEGTVAAYVWDYSEGARFLREFWDAAAAIDSEATDFDQGSPFPNVFAGRAARPLRTRRFARPGCARAQCGHALQEFRRLLAATPHRSRLGAKLPCEA